ncbi:MAG: phosphatase PAP2 family protein [bacterium]|nr:phosphatase PAP2 family protein [bacterium]
MSLDQIINTKVTLLQTEFLTKIMLIITNIMSTKGIIFLSLLLILFLAHKKRYQKVLLVILSIGGGIALELSFKALIQRARPENALIETTSYSFPSGHATLAIIFFSLIIYLFKDQIKNTLQRWIFIAANIFLILLIGFTRIYLNVHWFTDVLAGFILGILWLYLIIYLLKKSK